MGANGRVDLIWERDAGPSIRDHAAVLYDELKTTTGPLFVRRDGRARLQAYRYAQHGERQEPGFVGVRLLFLSAPACSLLVGTRGDQPLSTTPTWSARTACSRPPARSSPLEPAERHGGEEHPRARRGGDELRAAGLAGDLTG